MDDLTTGIAGVCGYLYTQLCQEQDSSWEQACERVAVIYCLANYPKLHILNQHLSLGSLVVRNPVEFREPSGPRLLTGL